MNSKRRALSLFFLAYGLLPLVAQNTNSHFPARSPGWVTLGLDGGVAFQSADVCPAWNGWGAGLTLAKNLAYRPGGLFSFDLRGRLLFTRTYGLDTKPAFGIQKNDALNGTSDPRLDYILDQSAPNDSSFVYQNYRHGMGELGLEGVLTFNRLRERTGVVFSLFGGIGLDLYRTKIDQLDANGEIYNYFDINENASKKAIRADLRSLLDGCYETAADGFPDNSLKFGLMPGAGLELGYQVTPHFMAGIGHKITFSHTDRLDGQAWTNNNQATGDNDWQHYTNLFLRWDIERRQRRLEPPVIEVTYPRTNPYSTPLPVEYLKARIRNVRTYADVQCSLNGGNQAFDLRSGNFGSNLRLRPGRNEVHIVATNTAGRDEATVLIYLDETPPPPPPSPSSPPPLPPSNIDNDPEVRIVEPARSPYTTSRDNINLVANVRKVRDRRDLRLTVNGSDASFTFNRDLEANVRLREGRNVIRVEANTPGGRASDEVEVFRQKEEAPGGKRPVVTITQPRNASESTSEKTYLLKATVDNVDSRDDITLNFNGNILRNFSYEARSHQVSADLTLRRGDNDVTLQAKNRFGQDEASVKITQIGGINLPRKPEISITEPADGATLAKQDVVLKATVKNVTDKSQLTLSINDIAIRSFDFNASVQNLSAPVRLKEGENVLRIRATNADGSDDASVKVTYKLPLPAPTVRLTDPATSVSTATKATATIKAVTQHVASRNDITFEVNRRPVPFNFEANTGAIQADIVLQEGDNAVSVKVFNATGNAQASATIRYAAPKAPEVTIISPENNSETRVEEVQLSAKILNVNDKGDISVLLNGTATEFTFDKSKQQISARPILREGANTIRVTAHTTAGSDDASVAVRYGKPKPPVVTIQTPKDQSVTDQSTATLTARIENVSGKRDVEVTHNGRAISDFSFDRGGNLSAVIPLTAGKNTLNVKASNAGRSDQKSVGVTYSLPAAIAKPDIVISQPIKPGLSVTEAAYNVKATIRGIKDKKQISVLVNGLAPRSFDFGVKTGVLLLPLQLKPGLNNIVIEASNEGGTANARTEITFLDNSVPLPEVNIESASQPAVSPFTPDEASSKVLANVKHIDKREQISIKVNGLAQTVFNFDPATGKMDFVAKLKRGDNSVEVRVENATGNDVATTSVHF